MNREPVPPSDFVARFSALAVSYASHLLRKAVKSGAITKALACEACGAERGRLEGHHEDYSQPLVVVWLCRRCHSRRHIQMAKDGVTGLERCMEGIYIKSENYAAKHNAFAAFPGVERAP